jgi:hypothetical protein
VTSADERAAVGAAGGSEDLAAPPRPRPGRAERVNAHPWWTLLVALMPVAGAAASIWAVTGGSRDPSPAGRASDPPVSTAPPSVGDGDPNRRQRDDEAARRPVQGDCLADDGSLAPCTAVHRYELLGTPGEDCDADAALAHLGGRSDVDVLLVGPEQVALSGGGQACALGDPEGQALTGPLADAFVRGTGARWRWCSDARSGRDVPCSEPHTAEYVGTAAPAPDLLGCQAAAEDYLEARFARVADRLTVTVVPAQPGSQRPTCSVNARGTQVLTDTLRGIGAEALPLG